MLDHIVFLTRMAESATSRGMVAKDEVAKIKNYAMETISKLDKHAVIDTSDVYPSKEIA